MVFRPDAIFLPTLPGLAVNRASRGRRRRVGGRVAVPGNMDPCALYASPQRIRQEAAAILSAYGHGPGYVFNLGHGIHQSVNPENVRVLVDAVHELSKPYHQT